MIDPRLLRRKREVLGEPASVSSAPLPVSEVNGTQSPSNTITGFAQPRERKDVLIEPTPGDTNRVLTEGNLQSPEEYLRRASEAILGEIKQK